MSKVLLINPPWHRRSGNVWKEIASCMPPLGLGYLASYLERAGVQVRILDAHAERIPSDEVPAAVSELRRAGDDRYDFIGLTATSALIHSACRIAERLKAADPDTKIVLGGVHPTVMPEEVLATEAVDYVVRGEGEQTMLDLAQGEPPEKIDGLSYRADGEVVHNPDRELIRDLDSLPFPAYHRLPMEKYYPALGAYRRLPATSLLATRGCPGRCTFCYRLFGHRLRLRSGRHVADEVKLLVDRYGFREIAFYDDTFTSVRRPIMDLCRILIEERVDVTWSCFSRVDCVDEELLRAMKAAGCHQMMYGFESASPQILAKLKKRTDRSQAEEAVRLTRKVGLDIRAAFMFGSPGETKETLKETLRWAIRLNPEIAIFNITTPYPGTEMYAWAKAKGYLLSENWDDYDLATMVMRLPTIGPEEVNRFYRHAFRKFYLRPGYILNRLRRLGKKGEWAANWRALRATLGV